MSVQINYKNALNKKLTNSILFVDENFSISGIKKYTSKQEYSYVSDLITSKDTKKKIISFDVDAKRKITLIHIFVGYFKNFLGSIRKGMHKTPINKVHIIKEM